MSKQPPVEEWRETEQMMGGILLVIAFIAVLILFIIDVVAGIKDFNANQNSWRNADRDWRTTKTIELQSLKKFSSQETRVERNSRSLRILLVKTENKDKFEFVYKTSDGGYKTDSIPVEKSTIYEIDDKEKPRIEYKKCYLKDPNSKENTENDNNKENSQSSLFVDKSKPASYDGDECSDYEPTPNKINIYVPKGSISDDISIDSEI